MWSHTWFKIAVIGGAAVAIGLGVYFGTRGGSKSGSTVGVSTGPPTVTTPSSFMRAALLFLAVIGLSANRLPAQQTSLSGPVEAFTFDAPTRSIRAVIGFSGAASFGPALLDNLDLASVAPGQNYGVVFESGKCLLVSGLGSKKISTAAIAGVTKYPDAIVWSGNGSLAILYSRAGDWFQTIAGFPNAPVAGASRQPVSSLGGSLDHDRRGCARKADRGGGQWRQRRCVPGLPASCHASGFDGESRVAVVLE